MIRTHWLVALAIFTLALSANANGGIKTVLFNFDNQQATSDGGLTILTMAKDGLAITIDRVGQTFDIASLSKFGGASAFGSRSLSPTPPGASFFNVNFSTPVTGFSAQLGDFTGVGSDYIAMTAFSGRNGAGANVASVFATLPLNADGLFAFKTLSVAGQGIESVRLIGGTSGAVNSVYYDNFRVMGNFAAGGGAGISSAPLPPGVYAMPVCAALAWGGAKRLAGAGRRQTRALRGRIDAIRRRRNTRAVHTRAVRESLHPHFAEL